MRDNILGQTIKTEGGASYWVQLKTVTEIGHVTRVLD